LRTLWRAVVIGVTTLAVIGIGVYWAGPVALSIWTARKAPNRVRVVPRDLEDVSISQATGSKLSYFGYEFEVPWDDLDPAQTGLYPKKNPNRVVRTFRSGLQLSVTALTPKELVNGIASTFHSSPQLFESFVSSEFGPDATRSDYAFANKLYEFTPRNMNRWAMRPSVHYRESMLLTIKATSLLWSADSGIFNIQNQGYKGFQQGSTQARPNGMVADLYSDEDGIEFLFNQKGYQNTTGVSQAEINRVIQSLNKVRGSAPVLLQEKDKHGLSDAKS
jgi:hypothetical protein